MAFQILVQQNATDERSLDKSLTILLDTTGTLKDETSIIDPVIMIYADLVTLAGANYMTIPVFGRSYFIRDITSIRNGLVEVSCHVDVLSSFAIQIRANRALVRRQENDWNLYINDDVIKIYQNEIVITKEFPAGFNTYQFILGVAGKARSLQSKPEV